MKKVKEIYYIDNREERTSDFSTGFVFVLEDGSKVETMTTDLIAERYTKENARHNSKEDKQLETFIAQAQEIAREWVIAEVEDKDTHPKYTDRISMVCELAKEVLGAEDDKEST